MPGDDLARLLAAAVNAAGLVLEHDDVLMVTQKIVSKAEGRFVELASITPSPRAIELAKVTSVSRYASALTSAVRLLASLNTCPRAMATAYIAAMSKTSSMPA